MFISSLGLLAFVAYTQAANLTVLSTAMTPNGFHNAARGWNSFGIQANSATTPSWGEFNQGNVTRQCDVLAQPHFKAAGYQYCSLDSGWSLDEGDNNGRLLYDPSLFDLPAFAEHLHRKGLLLGVYVLPGALCDDGNKTILGTNVQLKSTFNGNNDGFLRCDFDFSKPGVQEWHDSVIHLFASWGVDLVKVDFVTPGSPDNGANLVVDNSGAVVAYHKAIAKASRPMRLDISWKLERNNTYYDIWRANANTMRTDQDINNSGKSTFVEWATVQRAIENYRQYIVLQIPKDQPLSIYPDMDNLYAGNSAKITGVSDSMRETIMSHWLGAAANLITGSDLTNLDNLGVKLLTSQTGIAIADFAAKYLMQPRNPGSGGTDAKQLQAWIAGPDLKAGQAIVILANYGPDQGQGGFSTQLAGKQKVSISLEDLGLGSGPAFNVENVWSGKSSVIERGGSLSESLAEGESVLLKLSLR
ncbi:unnamed protein product [Penicillium salamii]|uniref:alpha-galactosidase n=1 Tax=Penicillium salamii TaxID=1612424 RepID=A0A9W4N4H7_9EURO|nr:unnamed protein product [Penicillium salamii]CAG7987404.1 unnamed protein product [Penicillium salamii]CAG7989316.1 unnamed protein product [Penicillium salamii]CAG8006552.1 unnamed protein product [Penicillium salamii]CAG8239037.1 unnamed protein product [Penicillium salamii]